MMKYKGYIGQFSYDDEARLFHGEVMGLRAVVTFQGKSVDEIEKAFHDSVDDYLEWCKERNVQPEKSFSGNLHIRISSTEHERLSKEAAKRGMSLNAFITEKLRGH